MDKTIPRRPSLSGAGWKDWREADWKRSSSMSEHGQAGPLRARARRRKAARALEKEDQVFAGKGAVLIVAYRLLSTDTAI